MIPHVNEKVKVGNRYGTIIKVFEPNKDHSGRFIVHIHDKQREYDAEFWFDDYARLRMKGDIDD